MVPRNLTLATWVNETTAVWRRISTGDLHYSEMIVPEMKHLAQSRVSHNVSDLGGLKRNKSLFSAYAPITVTKT